MSKDEFYDVWLIFKPDGTREEFESDWVEYEKMKAEVLRRRSLQ